MIKSIIEAIKNADIRAIIGPAIFVPLIIAFVVYAHIFKEKQDEKYNQFTNSPEGKALVVQYLFQCENIDVMVFERYLKSKQVSLVNKNPDLIYRGEIVLQYAFEVMNSVPAHFKREFIGIIKASPPPDIGIGSILYEEYLTCKSLGEKIAVIKAYIKLKLSHLSDNARERKSGLWGN